MTVLTLCLMLLMGPLTPAQSTSASRLSSADKAYQSERYAEAMAAYRLQFRKKWSHEGKVLFNLGNCAYRLGRYAEAVWYYRRAGLRMPRRQELAHNLRLAEQQLGIYQRQSTFSRSFWQQALTPSELLRLVVLLQGFGVLGLLLIGRGPARNASRYVLTLGACGALLLLTHWVYPPASPAVVMRNNTPLRTEPHKGLPPMLEMKAGEIIAVEESSDRWARVSHNSTQGWVRLEDLGIVR